nr:PREDICTED: uncharacterized protein LOC105671149 [Linepithema humile]
MASKRSNYKDFVWAIKLNRCAFKMIGLWPENQEETNTNNFFSNILASFIFIMITLVLVIPLIWSLVRIWSDMILMIDNLQLTIPIILSCLKLVIMRWKRSAILLIVNMMAEDWMYLSVDAERHVMIKQAQIARLFTIYEYSMGTFAIIILTVLPSFGLHFRHLTNLTDRDRVLPIQAYYFYDTDKSPQFELTLAAQFISMCFNIIIYVGGELVAKECEAVYRALCDLEWYKLEPLESRALILIMIRAGESFRITAGKIFPLSMATFCNVLKTSVGYISFLLAKRS